MNALKDNISVFSNVSTKTDSRHYKMFTFVPTLHLLKKDTSFLYHVDIPQGVGLRKSLNDPRQQRSHFCLSHDGAYSSSEETEGNKSVQQTDFTVKQAVNVPSSTRRFPHNHKQRAAEAALEDVMWFGRHDLNVSEVLSASAGS